MALDLAAIGVCSTVPAVVIVGVIVAGAFIGVNNTLVTTAVMSIAPVERPVASATYGFVRFIGGGLAPFVAGLLVDAVDPAAHLPFLIAAATVLAAAVVLSTVRKSTARPQPPTRGRRPSRSARRWTRSRTGTPSPVRSRSPTPTDRASIPSSGPAAAMLAAAGRRRIVRSSAPPC